MKPRLALVRKQPGPGAQRWLLSILFSFLAGAAGAQTLQTLCFFNGTNGGSPVATLVQGHTVIFYGTTYHGGAYNNGTVFRVTTKGNLSTLALFDGDNGAFPFAGLVQGSDGNFYGTTYQGGTYGCGTVFQVTDNGALTTLVSFNGTNGAAPYAGLAQDSDGNLYGTTYYGGITNSTYPNGMGTVFRVTTDGTLATLISFNGTNGAKPYAGLAQGSNGILYGTTTEGGFGTGTLFQVTTNGTLTTLVSFNGDNGAKPYAGLVQGSDGNFYGTTSEGGFGVGTVFQVTTNGMLTTLAYFFGNNGANPIAGLVQGRDGNFYGTTAYGNASGKGTVFQVTTNGMLTTLASFIGTNGAYPIGGLVQGSDGNLYGTTWQGGGNGQGTVFQLGMRPYLATQPLSQTKSAGSAVTFGVGATGLNPLSYQWRRDGTNLVDDGNISGSTSNLLTLTGISESDEGSYSVIVSNAFGSVVSSNATLTVRVLPALALQFSPSNLWLNLSGRLSNHFIVQYSTNLAGTNWMDLLCVSNLPCSPYQLLDPAGATQRARFYRAFQLP